MEKNNTIKGLLIVFAATTLSLLAIILYVCSYATQQDILFNQYVNAADSLIHELSIQCDTFDDTIVEKDIWYDYTTIRKEIR